MDVSSGLKVINAVASEGLDLRQFNRELVDYLRQLLLAKSGSADMIDATSDDLAEMQKVAGSTSLDYLLNAIKLFSGVDMRMDTYSPLPLELAMVESVISQHAREKSASDASSGRDWQSSRTAAATPRIVKVAEPARSAGLVGKSLKVAGAPPQQTAPLSQTGNPSTHLPDPPVISEPLKMDDPNDLPYLKVHWKDFINSMRGEGSGGNLDARLRHACEPVEIKGDNLLLGFYHEFHKKYIDDRKYLHLIEKKLKEVFGHNYTVTCVMMPQEQKSDLKPASSNHLVEAALSLGAKIVEEKAETEGT
jgi:DNA polymerase-3 subunit gamma/tau